MFYVSQKLQPTILVIMKNILNFSKKQLFLKFLCNNINKTNNNKIVIIS